jgi:hypothetical protein
MKMIVLIYVFSNTIFTQIYVLYIIYIQSCNEETYISIVSTIQSWTIEKIISSNEK